MESKFTTDVFISYAHIDDATFIKGDDGWVTSFHTALQTRLGQVLGEQVNIWRDNEQLQGNDMFADKIINQFEHTAIMISVITPRYVKSEWCNREVDEFIRIANTNHSIRIKDKLRIFKVLKTPVELELQPAAIRDTLGYEFYTKNHITKLETELSLESETRNQYKAVLERLAWDIKGVLEQLRKLEAERIRIANRTPEEIAESERLKEEKRLAEEARLAEELRLAEEKRLSEQKRLAEKVRIAEEKKRKKEEEEKKKADEKKKALKETARLEKLEEQKRIDAVKINLASKPENSFYTAIKYGLIVILAIGGLVYLFDKDPKTEPQPDKPKTISVWSLMIQPDDKKRIDNVSQLVDWVHDNMRTNAINFNQNEDFRSGLKSPRLSINRADFSNYTTVRMIVVGTEGINYYLPSKCKIENRGNNYYFETSSDLNIRSGFFYFNNKETFIYLGGITPANNIPKNYSSPNNEAGILFQISQDKLLMLIPKDNYYTLLEFSK